MREKSSRVLTSRSSRRPLRCTIASRRRIAWRAAGDLFLERTQHQRERGAEFVADIGEEGGLRAIDLGQRLGALALRLVGARAGEAGGDLRGDQIDEAGIRFVERPIGVDARDEHAGRTRLALLDDRHAMAARGGLSQAPVGSAGRNDRSSSTTFAVPRRIAPAGHSEPGASASSSAGAAAWSAAMPVRHDQARRVAGRIEQIGQRERQILLVGLERALDGGADLGLGAHGGKFRGE